MTFSRPFPLSLIELRKERRGGGRGGRGGGGGGHGLAFGDPTRRSQLSSRCAMTPPSKGKAVRAKRLSESAQIPLTGHMIIKLGSC